MKVERKENKKEIKNANENKWIKKIKNRKEISIRLNKRSNKKNIEEYSLKESESKEIIIIWFE